MKKKRTLEDIMEAAAMCADAECDRCKYQELGDSSKCQDLMVKDIANDLSDLADRFGRQMLTI